MPEIFEDFESKNVSDPIQNLIRNNTLCDLIVTFPTKKFAGNYIVLPAFIKSLSDSFSPSFSTDKAYGRMDMIPTFDQTTRDVSLSVGVPSSNSNDAHENLKKANILIQNCYPGYIKNGTQMVLSSPPLIRVKFANLLCYSSNPEKGLLGYIKSSVELNPNIEDYGVFIQTGDDGNHYILPKYFELKLNFTVLHEHEVGWNGDRFMSTDINGGGSMFPVNIGSKLLSNKIPFENSASGSSVSQGFFLSANGKSLLS